MIRLSKLPIIVIAFSLAIPRSGAAEPSQAEIAVARRLFEDARAAEDREDWSSAEAKLKDAIAIKETAGLRFHLAYCQERRGLLVEAMSEYERARELLSGKDDEMSRQIAAKRETLRKKTPTITVIPPSDVHDITISVDGNASVAGSLGKPIAENPGKHRFVATAPGHQAFTADVSLSEGDALVMTATMPPAAPARAPAATATLASSADNATPPAPRTNGSARTYVLIGEAAVTAISLGVGMGYAISASAADARIERVHEKLNTTGGQAACTPQGNGPPEDCADLQNASERAKDHRFFSQMGFIGAGVGAAAFTATWILWPRASGARRAILPCVSPQASGLCVTGRF